jgi:DMSO/TMAO reductase YedYZ molybdopterin-dependent catalytic subunit
MNGERLPVLHGQPLRLIVPGWYAVASVKWLTEIDVTNQAFTGYYQHDKYWYEYSRDGQVVRQPVTFQRVRALVTEPEPGGETRRGEVAVRGVAWSGAAPIARGCERQWRRLAAGPPRGRSLATQLALVGADLPRHARGRDDPGACGRHGGSHPARASGMEPPRIRQ